MSWAILCESADLAVQCLAAAQAIGLEVEARAHGDLRAASLGALAAGKPAALVCVTLPSLADLVELAAAARSRGLHLGLALPAPSLERNTFLDVAGELGICAVGELQPLMAALVLLSCGGADAYTAQTRSLPASERARLSNALLPAAVGRGQLIALDGHVLGYRADSSATTFLLGATRDVAEALRALRRIEPESPQILSSVDDVDARAVLDVIFGPKRALSDPTSKATLAPYGIPLPHEELCSSASRAASEAARIGFPVRISLASPDLRVWDHPELSVDMVDNAARVRDTFRQLIALAQTRVADDTQLATREQRILGVMVTETSEAALLLHVRATPLPLSRVAVRIGFADPHGRASHDDTLTVLPADPALIERALRRLAGADLLFAHGPAQRKARVEAIADVLLRVCAFVNDRRREIDSVELRPLALLHDGSAEVREACVSVSDYFERQAEGTPHKML